jgi:hypothetical protein
MSNDIASLPPAGVLISPSSGAPSVQERTATDKAAVAADERGFFDRIWGKEGFSFGALIDVINPLQHIPIVGTVYRAITGDSIGPAARIAGGGLFGGVIGLVAASIDTLVKEETGRDVGQHMLAMRGDEGAPADPTTPTGRPEREAVLFAGDFTPRGDAAPGAMPATMLADAAPNLTSEAAAPQQVAQQVAPQIIGAAAVPAQPAPRALPVKTAPQEAANGAGAAPVPFSSTVTRGTHASALPTPQALAADPSLMRQMQTTRAQGAAIRANLSADAATAPSFLDYMPKAAAQRAAESDQRQQDKAQQKVSGETVAPLDPAALPQVPADLITRMNMALEKYQTMQRVTDRPAVNVTQ